MCVTNLNVHYFHKSFSVKYDDTIKELKDQDAQIIRLLAKGDLSAFDTLFIKYYRLLCVNAYFFMRDEQEAKDIVQSLFVDIWEKKLYFQFHMDVKGYLFKATKNRCLNQISKQKTKAKNYRAFAELQDSHTSSHNVTAVDYHEKLNKSMDKLACQKKLAVEMVYIKGKRYQEAADEMQISINSFKTHLKSGLKSLRIEVKKDKES